MKNIFAVLKKKLTRREKKGKPVPVVPPLKKRERPVPAESPYSNPDGGEKIRAVFMQPPLRQTPRGAYWDEEARVYKGNNYLIQAAQVERDLRQRREVQEYLDRSMVVPVEIFYEEPESPCKAPESPSGYDYPRETVSSSYEPSGTLYEAPTYSPPSSTSD